VRWHRLRARGDRSLPGVSTQGLFHSSHDLFVVRRHGHRLFGVRAAGGHAM